MSVTSNCLQVLSEGYDYLLNIIANGSKRNPDNFPHAEIKEALTWYKPANLTIFELVPTPEVNMYLTMVESLDEIQAGMKKGDGKLAFSYVIAVVKYLLNVIQQQLEELEKQKKVNEEWSLARIRLETEIKQLRAHINVLETPSNSPTKGSVVSVTEDLSNLKGLSGSDAPQQITDLRLQLTSKLAFLREEYKDINDVPNEDVAAVAILSNELCFAKYQLWLKAARTHGNKYFWTNGFDENTFSSEKQAKVFAEEYSDDTYKKGYSAKYPLCDGQYFSCDAVEPDNSVACLNGESHFRHVNSRDDRPRLPLEVSLVTRDGEVISWRRTILLDGEFDAKDLSDVSQSMRWYHIVDTGATPRVSAHLTNLRAVHERIKGTSSIKWRDLKRERSNNGQYTEYKLEQIEFHYQYDHMFFTHVPQVNTIGDVIGMPSIRSFGPMLYLDTVNSTFVLGTLPALPALPFDIADVFGSEIDD